ncbi:hypothetical protein WMO13_06630 [Ignatzschineria larvae DSM 13226]|uniref:Nucleoid-associated protein n=1 Tax=Ignatzschineria larvae DSM 13226 TaxID=1111732 RepID=A0ABZ3C247_9GAMM|nr:hypothetical protein [Ignatzschineria larvae]
MSFELKCFSFHSISVKSNLVEERAFDGATKDDVENYIKHVLTEVTTPPKNQTRIRGQFYNFRSMNERVAANLKAMTEDLGADSWALRAVDNAKKLLDVEIDVQRSIDHLKHEVRKGCLLQVVYRNDNELSIAVLKIDDNTFLDSDVMALKTGLPLNTRMQKVALVTFKDDGEVASLLLSDTNTKISAYWRNDFLEAVEIREASINTRLAFDAIDKLLKREIKKASIQDYYFLRNQLVLDFRKDSFDFTELVDKFKDYSPVNPDLDDAAMSTFINKLQNLPKTPNKEFDTQFDIAENIIKARVVNSIMIDDIFELKVKQPIEDLENKLDVGKDGDGRKYVKLYSDQGYETFKKK